MESTEELVNIGKIENEGERSSLCMEKNTDFQKKSHFEKPEYVVGWDHNKENLFGAPNSLEKHIEQLELLVLSVRV